MRNPNTTTARYELGHWEAMQISIALHNLADRLDDLDIKLHTRDLARIFDKNNSLFAIELQKICF